MPRKAKRKLVKIGKGGDFTIRCEDKDFKVKRSVLVEKGPPYFKDAYSVGDKKSSTSILELADQDPETVHSVLKFIYDGNYEAAGSFVDEQLLHHARVERLAMYFRFWSLESLACRKLRDLWSNVRAATNATALLERTIDFVYSSPNASGIDLRAIVADAIVELAQNQPHEFRSHAVTESATAVLAVSADLMIASAKFNAASIAKSHDEWIKELSMLDAYYCSYCRDAFIANTSDDNCPDCDKSRDVHSIGSARIIWPDYDEDDYLEDDE